MVSIARNVNNKNNEEYVVQILRFKGGIVYNEDHWCSYVSCSLHNTFIKINDGHVFFL